MWHVDTWDPGYGTSFEPGDAAPDATAEVEVDVEREAAAWKPLDPPAGARRPDVVLLVDGVRRIDAGLWSREPDGDSHPGLAASYAAGVVRCDLRAGAAAVLDARIARGLFTSSPTAGDLVTGAARYTAYRVAGPDPGKLAQAVQPRLTELEVAVSAAARSGGDGLLASEADGVANGDLPVSEADGDLPVSEADGDLLIVDGPLRGRRNLPRTIGYVKAQHQLYLPPDLLPVVTGLAAGQRTPVFRRGTRWRSYSWYLRLPGPGSAPWAGIVRVECSAEMTAQEAIGLADVSSVTLPRFASTAYKDPRAPQNLIPIAGLERRLKALLGDARLLHRALTLASAPRRGAA